ncbi:MAG: Fe-S cluster domain-containing protein [Culturomica sp.]|jgi:Na+-translocating ferredoxin:NAD+ oxidoreductase RNF subunit RnfB|nr:Fe-S cluster domain-containing protein [Culturomica sp.]
MNTILITVISLCAIGVVAAIILYFVAQKFKVEEDPRIDTVESLLPGANCGGCGYPGCRGFSETVVKSENMDGLLCPVGGAATMSAIATALGRNAAASTPKIAVVRCNGSCENRPHTNKYDGAASCAVVHSLYAGETGCSYGCLGCGDCVSVCKFDAIAMSTETGLPVVADENCVACGACVKACPKGIIELRNKGVRNMRIFVSCINKDKGGIARKACSAACIGCGKCFKECSFEAIKIENNLAYIDFTKCKMCRKCVAVCPTGAIHELNFPPRKQVVPTVETKEE